MEGKGKEKRGAEKGEWRRTEGRGGQEESRRGIRLSHPDSQREDGCEVQTQFLSVTVRGGTALGSHFSHCKI